MPELIVRKWDLPLDYMVFKERGLVKARRGDTGEIQFEDVSATDVLLAIKEAMPDGVHVLIKRGLYWVEKTLVWGTNDLIVGEGASSTGTVLKAKEGLNDNVVEIKDVAGGTYALYAQLCNLRIDGNKDGQTATSNALVIDARHSTFKDLCVINAKTNNILLGPNYSTVYNTFLNIRLFSAGYIGLNAQSAAAGNDFFHVNVNESADAGVYVSGINNHFYWLWAFGHGGDGIAITGDYNRIIGGASRENTKCGVVISGNGNVIAYMLLYLNGRAGAYVYSGNDNVLESLHSWNNGQVSQPYGIDLYDALRTIIKGCRCWDDQDPKTQTYGVYEHGASDYTLLDSCILVGNATAGHNVDAANSVVGDVIT